MEIYHENRKRETMPNGGDAHAHNHRRRQYRGRRFDGGKRKIGQGIAINQSVRRKKEMLQSML